MLGIFITFLTFVLILVTLFMGLVILMQRPNTNAGMGAAFGGGVTESTFGAETTNVLTRATRWAGITFFALALVLYALYLVDSRPEVEENLSLPEFAVEETPAAPTDESLAVAEEADPAEAVDDNSATLEDSILAQPVDETADEIAETAENATAEGAETVEDTSDTAAGAADTLEETVEAATDEIPEVPAAQE